MTSAMRVDVRPPQAAFHSAARGGGDGALDAAVGGGDGEWDHLHISRELLSSGQESHSLRTTSSLGEWGHLTFSLGRHGSGVQFHNHPEAWNALLFGRKRWFLMPYDHLYDWHERKRFIYGFGMKVSPPRSPARV